MRLTRQDIVYVINEAKAIVKEEATRREVRGIIISNILAKHPGFEGDKDLAWAYYVYQHQQRREGEENEVPAELMARMKAGLKKDYEIEKQIKAIEAEKKAEADRAYEEWKSDPEAMKEFEVNFDINPEELETEDGAFEALKRLEEYRKSRIFRKKVNLRTPSGVEFSREWGDPNAIENTKKLKEIEDAIRGKLLSIQTEYGKEHYPEHTYVDVNGLYWSGEIENESSEKVKMYKMVHADKKAQWIGTQLGRCYYESTCPKYNYSETVDSSD